MRRIFFVGLDLLKVTNASERWRRGRPLYEDNLLVDGVRLKYTRTRVRMIVQVVVALIRACNSRCTQLCNRKTRLVFVLWVVLSQRQIHLLLFIWRRRLHGSHGCRSELSCWRWCDPRSLLVVWINLVGLILVKGYHLSVLVMIPLKLLQSLLVKGNILSFNLWRYGVIMPILPYLTELILVSTCHFLSLGHTLLLLEFVLVWSRRLLKVLNGGIRSDIDGLFCTFDA